MTRPSNQFFTVERAPVVIALAVLCAAAAFYVYAVRPAEARLQAIEEVIETRTLGATAKRTDLTPQTEIAAQLGQFYAFFDGELTYADWLARFYDVAERAGVAPPRVEYRSSEPAGIPLVLHEVSLPVTADYAKIRRFAEGVLINVPVVSLDQVTFKRPRTDQPDVEADLRFTFYLPRP